MSTNNGKFICARPMEGDETYAKGDARELEVTEALDLVRSGALVPATKSTVDKLLELDPDIEDLAAVRQAAKDMRGHIEKAAAKAERPASGAKVEKPAADKAEKGGAANKAGAKPVTAPAAQQ